MEKKLSILLVEDDTITCTQYSEYISTLADIELLGTTSSSVTALQYVREYSPDAVILDIELTEGYGSGISFLKNLSAANITFVPYILVATNISSRITYNLLHELGADFIISKHQADYSIAGIIDFLRMMKNSIYSAKEHYSSFTKSDSITAREQELQNKDKLLRKEIANEINLVGINPKYVGYKYLIDAIFLTMQKYTANISGVIAQKYNKTSPSVERAMQNAINRAWRSTDIEALLQNYTAKINSSRGVPTIVEFIFYYSSKITNNRRI